MPKSNLDKLLIHTFAHGAQPLQEVLVDVINRAGLNGDDPDLEFANLLAKFIMKAGSGFDNEFEQRALAWAHKVLHAARKE